MSLKFGNENPGDFGIKEDAYTIVYNFIDNLEKKLGDLSCRSLLGVPIKEQSDIKQAATAGVFDTICHRCIEVVATELEKLVS